MTIAHSARKIIKTQRFIFRALPALLVSVFVLNACSGAVPVTVNNSSDSNEEIAKLKQDATTADNRITELEEASRRAGIAKTTADNDIIRLKNEAVQAGIAKASADSEIIILQGQLATAIGERGTANGMITILQGQLQEANNNQNPDDSATVTRLRSQLLMAINDKNAADMRITTLEGQLSTAMGNEQTASNRITELEDAIQLIEDARITFADWAGTAEAPKTTVIDSAGTVTEPLLNGVASVGDGNGNQSFIQGLAIVEGQGFDFAGTAFADATVLGDVLLLEADSPSGVAFSRVTGTSVSASISGGLGFYAGLLPTTNLGAPITDINTDAIWDAKVMLIASPNRYSNSDFKMRVTFDGNEGTINSGTLSGGVFTAGEISVPYTDRGSGGSHPFNIQGRFGSDGLLYGTVILNASSSLSIGRLTGLIGADGAVGAITGFTSTTGVGPYAGGFVAYPTTTDPRIAELEKQIQALRRVEYANWEAGKTPDASPDTANPRHQFLQNRNRTLDTGTTTQSATTSDAPTILTFDSSDFRFDGRPVSLDTNDGFATFTGYHSDGTNYGYIGILDTTDFGAPLADSSTALIWNGSFLHESTYTDFALTINVAEMGNGDIDAFFKLGKDADYNILLTGTFDAKGVIIAQGMGSVFTGNDRDFPTGTASEFSITGLIGADGALGIFSNENVGVGGFFVTPTAVPDPNVGYSKWAKALDLDIIPDTADPRDQYLLIRDGKFNTGTTTDSATTSGTPQLLPRFSFNTTDFEYDGRPVGTDTNDGFTGFIGYHSDGTDRAYFSILDTTDLGAPLSPTSTSLKWNGSFLYGSARPTRADFTLTIDVKETGDGTIDAFFKLGRNDFYLLLTGGFDANGVITADAVPGIFTGGDRDIVERKILTLPLTGLIGADGAFAFYYKKSYAGISGFFVTPTAVPNPNVRYNNWVAAVNPDARPDTANPRDQYLQNKDGVFDTGTTKDGPSSFSPPQVSLRFDTTDFQYDGQPVGTDTNDGVAGFVGYHSDGTARTYLSILDTTNLGLPVSPNTSLKWNGSFLYASGTPIRTDFTLTIDVEAMGGGTIDAFVPLSPNAGLNLVLTGGFDANGVITAEATTGSYSSYGRDSLIQANEPLPLTGLIGSDGAFAFYHSPRYGSLGGFFVSPTAVRNPDIRIRDWFDSFSPSFVFPIPMPANLANEFLRESGGTLLTLDTKATVSGSASPTVAILNLDGNTDNEVAFFSGATGNTLYHYAGILSDVNVGVPLGATFEGEASAEWNGLIQATNMMTPTDFTLRINFATPSIKAIVQNGLTDNYYYLDGTYTDMGVITGTVNYGTFSTTTLSDSVNPTPMGNRVANGVLTGLIGQGGAVGVFVSGTTTDDGRTIADGTGETGFAGGFVAAPPAVNYADWVRVANPDAKPNLANPRHQFLQTAGGIIDTTGTTKCPDSVDIPSCGAVGSRTAPDVPSINLQNSNFDGRPINGDINDGFNGFIGFIGDAEYAYLGILDGTDLGTPLTGDAETSVQWHGRFGFNTDFTLTITFDAAGGRLDAFIHSSGNVFYRLQNARFDTGGVITGTLNWQSFTDSDPTKPIDSATDGLFYTGDSVLSGLIGEEGLVAVFVGEGVGGGFVARPDITFNPDVTRNDWTRKVGDIRQAVTSVPRNQFLHSPNTGGVYTNSDGTGDVTAEALNLRTATFNGNPLGSDNVARMGFFSGYNGGTRHYYAGLGSPFGLGATLPVWQTGQPTSAEWKGQFGVVQGANAVVNADLTLEVNFENRRLTAFVPVGANHYLLDAGFNADDDGFFAGTVNFGAFTDTTNRTSTNTLTSGVLTGLIGAEGALGAFVSGSTTDNGRTITGGEGENGFAGGFVACPYDETNNECQQ